MKFKRIVVEPQFREALCKEVEEEFGSCSESTMFRSLSFRITNSPKSKFIVRLALDKYHGCIIEEERRVL